MVQKPWIVPISGTTQMTHMVDKIGAAAIRFTPDEVAELNATLNQARLAGHAPLPPCWSYPRGSTNKEIENEAMHYEYPKDGGGFRMTRRIDALLMIAFAAICLLSGAAGAQQRPAKGQGLPTEKKILIVYLSRTNNTKAVAEMIQQKVGGRMVALELETPYPADYNATVQQVVRENETGYLPPLKTKIHRIGRLTSAKTFWRRSSGATRNSGIFRFGCIATSSLIRSRLRGNANDLEQSGGEDGLPGKAAYRRLSGSCGSLRRGEFHGRTARLAEMTLA